MKEKLNRWDCVEMRTALLWLWLAGFALFAFVLSFNWPAMNFAQWPIAFFFAVSVIEGLRYFALALRGISESADYYAEEEEEDAENAQFGTQRETTPRYSSQIGEIELKARASFYSFIHDVVKQGRTSETDWKTIGTGRYRNWIALLEQLAIVSPTTQGRGRRVLVSFDEALERVADDIAQSTGIRDYWGPVRNLYHTAGNGNTLLVPAD